MTIDSRTASAVDVSAFRKAMGSFPTGVTIVTVACDDVTMHGVTVNSFPSVSLDPMLVLVCLAQTSRAVDLIEGAGRSPSMCSPPDSATSRPDSLTSTGSRATAVTGDCHAVRLMFHLPGELPSRYGS